LSRAYHQVLCSPASEVFKYYNHNKTYAKILPTLIVKPKIIRQRNPARNNMSGKPTVAHKKQENQNTSMVRMRLRFAITGRANRNPTNNHLRIMLKFTLDVSSVKKLKPSY